MSVAPATAVRASMNPLLPAAAPGAELKSLSAVGEGAHGPICAVLV